MIALNDIQKQIVMELRRCEDTGAPLTEEELQDLELMAFVADDKEMEADIRSIIEWADVQ